MKIVRRGRAAGRAASRACSTCATARRASASSNESRRRAATVREEDIWPGFVDQVLSFVDVEAMRPLRVVIDAANGMAGAMLPPVLERLPIEAVRATSSRTGPSRTTSRTRCCPRTASSSSRRRSRRAPTSASPSTATPTAASSSTTRASSSPATSSRRCSPSRSSRRSRAAKVIYDVRASWAVPETIERAGGDAARQPRRPRVHQAPHAQGGRRLRRRGLRRTTTSATSRRPTRASSRSCSCSS